MGQFCRAPKIKAGDEFWAYAIHRCELVSERVDRFLQKPVSNMGSDFLDDGFDAARIVAKAEWDVPHVFFPLAVPKRLLS